MNSQSTIKYKIIFNGNFSIIVSMLLFQHNFKNYCFKPRESQSFERHISLSEIIPNTFITASFFPDKSFLYRIRAKSFMRHQVRIMMGSLFRVGMHQISIEELKESLSPGCEMKSMIAPASGLMLNTIVFQEQNY